MNKKNKIFSVLLFISLLPISLFSSCDKDTHCYLNVHVLDEATREPVSGVTVKIYQPGNTIYSGDNAISGLTDEKGIYKHAFDAPAILKIDATLDVQFGERRGTSDVRLEEGKTKDATITLSTQVF